MDVQVITGVGGGGGGPDMKRPGMLVGKFALTLKEDQSGLELYLILKDTT